MSGLKLAVLYGIKPFLLGFCGPQGKKEKKILLDFLNHKKVSLKEVRKILEQFEGAYPYYQQIAKSKKIKDPFDERAVRAYWLTRHIHHVMIVGSVTGRIKLVGKLRDLCRICWGQVKRIKNYESRITNKLLVKYQPLTGKKLGKPIKKEIEWDKSKDVLPTVA